MTDLPLLAHANASFVTPQLLVGGDLDITDDELSERQLRELVDAGVTHIIDCRLEADDAELVGRVAPEVEYRWDGIDDAGQRVPAAWFDEAVGHALEALADPGSIVLTHCHMGINRGPSLGYAVLLAQGWDVVDAIAAIREARPIAHVAYAEDALRWHHERSETSLDEQRDDRERLFGWRQQHPVDLVRIIAERREQGQ